MPSTQLLINLGNRFHFSFVSNLLWPLWRDFWPHLNLLASLILTIRVSRVLRHPLIPEYRHVFASQRGRDRDNAQISTRVQNLPKQSSYSPPRKACLCHNSSFKWAENILENETPAIYFLCISSVVLDDYFMKRLPLRLLFSGAASVSGRSNIMWVAITF